MGTQKSKKKKKKNVGWNFQHFWMLSNPKPNESRLQTPLILQVIMSAWNYFKTYPAEFFETNI